MKQTPPADIIYLICMSFCNDLYSGYIMENTLGHPETMNEIIQKGVKQAARLFHDGNLPACQLLVSQLLRADPDNDEALQIAGLLKLRIDEGPAAISFLEKARKSNPENPDHHNNLALGYSRVGRYDDAINCLESATTMAPGRQVFWVNYAVQLRNKANQDLVNREVHLNKAQEFLFKAIELNPTASAHANLGSLYAERKDMVKAVEQYNKALEIDSTLAGVHVDLSYVHFLMGNFKEAWEHYEYRMKHYPQASRLEKVFPSSKRWNGKTNLEDKTVVVFCEQGCGDAIHFARYLSLLHAKRLIIWCHEPLKGILSEFGETVGMGEKIPAYDVSIPIMSLPYLLSDPVVKTPYIECPPPAIGMESYKDTFNIGIVWSGNPQHPGDRFRSIPVKEFATLAIPGVTLFSLQKDYRPRKYHDSDEVVDLCKDGPKTVDLSPLLNTFTDTANFISAMDLIVSVDTAVLHLASAMGKKTWGLIPYSPDWRWGYESRTTQLYPSLELFRQPNKGDWCSVMGEVGMRIRELVKPRNTFSA
jgi:tetratricopeptide (TPR) repeat protein